MSADLFDMPKDHDVGGKVRLRLQGHTFSSAVFSECRKHRFSLERRWTGATERDPYALWIGMNPSTADEDFDDTTVRRESHYTRSWGLHRYVKVNICSYRATHPHDVDVKEMDGRTVENFRTILRLALSPQCRRVVAAWGNVQAAMHHPRDALVRLLQRFDVEVWCLGTTKEGAPRHPSRLPHGLALQLWTPP